MNDSNPEPQLPALSIHRNSQAPPASIEPPIYTEPPPLTKALVFDQVSSQPGTLTQTLRDLREHCDADKNHRNPNLPAIEIVPNETASNCMWKDSDQPTLRVFKDIDDAYEQTVFFKQNLMHIPSGNVTKQFISELTSWITELNNRNSRLNSHAMKAFMVLPDLLLQKPTRRSKAKDNSQALKRRLDEWNKGNIRGLLKEAKQVQSKLDAYHKSHRSIEAIAKTFSSLINDGKINAAMKMLDESFSGGLLPLSPEIINQLEEKHPKASSVSDEALLQGPLEPAESYTYDRIDEMCIKRAALKTKGSAGPSGMHADMFRSILCSNKHAKESKDLREQIALLTRQLSINAYHPSLLEPLVACRLIPLAKNPGIRPIGVGETLRRIMGKAVSWVLKEDIKQAAGPLQTCASHGAGAEAAIHGMREIFDKEETEAVLLVDAKNAFNCLNRKAALHNIRFLCPPLANYIINTYREPSRFFVTGCKGEKLEIRSEEGTTQGDPLAMGWYAVETRLLIDNTRTDGVSQVWLADDAAGAGELRKLLQWYNNLETCGNKWGYLVNGSKCWLIVKPEVEEKAKELFGNRVNITTKGKRHLGAALGSAEFRDEYSRKLVEDWAKQLEVLCDIAMTQPQAAYTAFVRGFNSKFTYFQRTIPDFGKYLPPIQHILDNKFIPTLFGTQSVSAHVLEAVSLPVRHGGLGIPNLVKEAAQQFEGSSKITSLHKQAIIDQLDDMPVEDCDGLTAHDWIQQHVSEKAEVLKETLRQLDESLPEQLLRFVKQARDKGAGNWLTALPLASQGFNLSKSEFRDGLRLRYNIPITDIPSYCVCGEPFNTSHALDCKKGGFVSQRHDNVRDLFTGLLNRCCSNVSSEPHLTDLQGEIFQHRTANTAQGARLDIKARNFWRQGQDAYFDVRVTHVNAKSQAHKSTASIFKKHEENKKREYNERVMEVEHGTFTPLIIGTNGGMGEECQRFVKWLAELLALKQMESYASTVSWIRTKLSFEVIRSAVLGVRGSRTPWKRTSSFHTDDFGLLAHNAKIDTRQ